jgi:hypothetical protein
MRMCRNPIHGMVATGTTNTQFWKLAQARVLWMLSIPFHVMSLLTTLPNKNCLAAATHAESWVEYKPLSDDSVSVVSTTLITHLQAHCPSEFFVVAALTQSDCHLISKPCIKTTTVLFLNAHILAPAGGGWCKY